MLWTGDGRAADCWCRSVDDVMGGGGEGCDVGPAVCRQFKEGITTAASIGVCSRSGPPASAALSNCPTEFLEGSSILCSCGTAVMVGGWSLSVLI